MLGPAVARTAPSAVARGTAAGAALAASPCRRTADSAVGTPDSACPSPVTRQGCRADAEPFDALLARCADIAARANRAGASLGEGC